MPEKIPLGCIGNKKNELKLLIPIIKENIKPDDIFVEPFCGSCIVSYNVFKNCNINKFHLNDLNNLRIDFYNNMLDENKRNELYKIEEEIKEKGEEEYYKYVKKNKKENFNNYWSHIISLRIHSFRHGLFPTNRKIILSKIPDKWIELFNKSIITCEDWKETLNKYKDNENAFIYLDPPYLDSYNASYNQYQKSHDENAFIIDNTKIYIDILEYLKNAKCKILFSINKNAITEHIYKDYIKNQYLKRYDMNAKRTGTKENFTTKKGNVLIISNFVSNNDNIEKES